MFIAEIWADETRLKQIKKDIQFDCLFFVPKVNRGGGLAILWKNSINLLVESFSRIILTQLLIRVRVKLGDLQDFMGN